MILHVNPSINSIEYNVTEHDTTVIQGKITAENIKNKISHIVNALKEITTPYNIESVIFENPKENNRELAEEIALAYTINALLGL